MFRNIFLFAICIFCLYYYSIYILIFFEIIRRCTERIFFSLGIQNIFSFFLSNLRARLRSLYIICFYSISGILVSLFVYTYREHSFVNIINHYLLILLLIIITSSILLYFVFKKIITDLSFQFLRSSNKEQSIAAVNALSYIKPYNYTKQLNYILEKKPNDLLRKNIIIALGYSSDTASTNTLEQQFELNKESIQLAVLDALKIKNNISAIKILVDIMRETKSLASWKPRANSTKIIASIYGRKAIPFFIGALDDHDERIVANTLETLSYFQDIKLAPYFLNYIDSQVPRIKANALLGLSSFSIYSNLCIKHVQDVLDNNDTAMIQSIIFVIGKSKQRFLTRLGNLILETNSATTSDLKIIKTWLSVQLKRKKSIEKYQRLFFDTEIDVQKLIHFYLAFK